MGSIPLISRKVHNKPVTLHELLAGPHRVGLRRSLAVLVAKLHDPLQPGLECLADRLAALLQGEPIDRAVLVAVPLSKQPLLQAQQLRSELSAGSRAFSDGGEVVDQVRPAKLALLVGQVHAAWRFIAAAIDSFCLSQLRLPVDGSGEHGDLPRNAQAGPEQ